MINHLTEDQFAGWILGRATTVEQRHVDTCRACSAELDRFGKTLNLFRTALTTRADRHMAFRPPDASVFAPVAFGAATAVSDTRFWLTSLIVLVRDWWARRDAPALRMTATPIAVKEIWSNHKWRYSGALSIVVHVAVVGALALPMAILKSPPPSSGTIVSLINDGPLIQDTRTVTRSQGGGGGGMRTPTPPSKGIPPRGADKQLTPPVVEIRNFAPDLIVEPTVVAPQLAYLPQFSLTTIGDPNGVVGPPSAGPGSGGGIGTGTGRGVGPGVGPGVGEGRSGGFGGGTGGGIFSVGGGVTEPRILFQPQPEYSEDGRKARAQGSVEMLVVVKADGTVDVQEVTKRLGYGLDQKAIDAVKLWRFAPGRKDGSPVPVYVSIVVNFSLR